MAENRRLKLRLMLEQKRNQLEREIEDKHKSINRNAIAQQARHTGNLADMSVMNSDQHVEYTLLEMKRQTLSKINAAIHRLDKGIYGKCDCGEEISLKRLEALPFAIRCKDCEETSEATGKNRKEEETSFITGLSSWG